MKERIEAGEFGSPQEKEEKLEECRKELQAKEKKVNDLTGKLESSLYPLLESLGTMKSLGISTVADVEGMEQMFYLAIEQD